MEKEVSFQFGAGADWLRVGARQHC